MKSITKSEIDKKSSKNHTESDRIPQPKKEILARRVRILDTDNVGVRTVVDRAIASSLPRRRMGAVLLLFNLLM